MTIRQRLFIGVFAAILLAGALAAYGLSELTSANKLMQRAHEGDAQVIASALFQGES